jgi:plastocyanin
MKFEPASLTIARGTTVVWTDVGTQPHTVTCNPNTAINKADVSLPSGAAPWDSGVIMGGQSYKHTFTVAGLYRYVCVPHEMMGRVASIQVT